MSGTGHWCVDTGLCIGCSVCSDTDPTVFGLDEEEGIAFVLAVPERADPQRAESLESEEDCPVEAIFYHRPDETPVRPEDGDEREPVCVHPTLKRHGDF